MIGVVLCGGQSTRMGRDKGLLPDGLTTWAGLTAQKILALPLPVVVSVNPQQSETYAKLFPGEWLVVDNNDLGVKGPLTGLLSVHQRWPAETLLVVACDLKNMTTALLHQLATEAAGNAAEAIVYTTGDHLQPLCGVYRPGGLAKILRLAQAKLLSRFSLIAVLEHLETALLPVAKNDLPAFANFNRAEDLGQVN